jgi:heme oxygenase (mycobilin-producing)
VRLAAYARGMTAENPESPQPAAPGTAPAGGVVKINAISVPPPAREELERRFAARAHTVDGADGFLGFQLLRPVAGEDRYFVLTRWRDDAAFEAWRDGDARAAHAGEGTRPVASGADLLEFEIVLDVRPS